MMPKEKRMEVLEAFDLTKSFRAAGQLTGVDHHTVANAVAARARGLEVQVQVVGDPGRPGPAVTRATLGALHEVLRSLPGQPVTLTILAVGGNVELYLTFDQAPVPRWDLAALPQDLPPEAGWAATADAGDSGPGCLEVRWRIEGETR